MGEMTLKEFQKKGGDALKDKYGMEHYRKIGSKSVQALRKKYGDDYFKKLSELGRAARANKKIK